MFDIPFLDNNRLDILAEEFLVEHNSQKILPVPIEEIAEAQLGLLILPVSHLETTCEISGTMSKDFRTILVDEKTYNTQGDRTRFTVAHEVGHYILHKEAFEKANGTYTIEDFVSFQNGMTIETYKKLEYQAFRFAESTLFPKVLLNETVEKIVSELGGKDKLIITDVEILIERISAKFGISGRACFNKLKRDYPSIIEMASANIPF